MWAQTCHCRRACQYYVFPRYGTLNHCDPTQTEKSGYEGGDLHRPVMWGASSEEGCGEKHSIMNDGGLGTPSSEQAPLRQLWADVRRLGSGWRVGVQQDSAGQGLQD